MQDELFNIGNTVIQHGKLNDRVYLMKLDINSTPHIVNRLEKLSCERGYSKVFAKVPEGSIDKFINEGYVKEAYIPKFYNYKTGCAFLCKYQNTRRRKIDNQKRIDEVINTAVKKAGDKEIHDEMPYKVKKMKKSDTEKMSKIYSRVFKTYPFPISNPEYIKKTMDEGVVYFGAYQNEVLVGLSSAETHIKEGNAEMTDFAVLPEYRGANIALNLLRSMEKELNKLGIQTAYTIARAVSFGMNITFAKNGYNYVGTLFNNTNISGSIESMNVWYKHIVKKC